MNNFKWPLMENAITLSDKLKMIQFIIGTDKFTNGPRVKQFEQKWNDWLGAKYSLFVSSGSTANSLLISSIKELYNLKDGDKVLVPSCTWMTNIAPIIQNNFQPVFCDISLDNYCINMDDLEIIKTKHPDIKIIFVTHLLGFHCDVEKLRQTFPNAIILEDCCEAHGVKDNQGNKSGKDSEGATFSFYFGHHMTTIEGGFVSTHNEELYNLMKMKRSHGLARESSKEKYDFYKKENPEIIPTFLFPTDGYNFRNNEISAVLGIQQLKRLDNFIKIRNDNYKKYYQYVSEFNHLLYVPEYNDKLSSFALPFVCRNKVTYLKLKSLFTKNKIEFRPLVAGNLLRQPFLKNYSFAYDKVRYNADVVHDLGLYIGNNQFINKNNFKTLKDILEEIYD